MSKIKNFFVILFVFLFASCHDEIGEITIAENGGVSFNVNGVTWTASKYSLASGPLVVRYIDQPNAGSPFRQYAIIAQGLSPDGLRFQLSLIFATNDEKEFVGTYTPVYTADGGLDQILLNQETGNNTNLYSHYQFCPEKDPLAKLEIARQDREERLVLGTFNGNLCHIGTDGKKVTISDGDFKDIKYEQN